MEHDHNVTHTDPVMVQSGMRFREDLWRRAKQACLDHDTTLQALCNEGLELRLAELERQKTGEAIRR
jgi:hypothetical protein